MKVQTLTLIQNILLNEFYYRNNMRNQYQKQIDENPDKKDELQQKIANENTMIEQLQEAMRDFDQHEWK